MLSDLLAWGQAPLIKKSTIRMQHAIWMDRMNKEYAQRQLLFHTIHQSSMNYNGEQLKLNFPFKPK